MKKILALSLSVALISSFASCGSDKQTNPSQTNESTNTEISVTEEATFKFADLIPDPESVFENGTINIIDSDGGTGYTFSVSNINKDEYFAYVEKCKSMGFDNVSHESETMFQARTADDNYYVSLQYWVESEDDPSLDSINITCGIPRK